MNADWAPGGHQPSDQTNRFGLWVRRKIGCYHPQTPSPFITITQLVSWYSFYRPTVIQHNEYRTHKPPSWGLWAWRWSTLCHGAAMPAMPWCSWAWPQLDSDCRRCCVQTGFAETTCNTTQRKSLQQQDTINTRLLYDLTLCKLIVISVINLRITKQSYRTA